MYKNIFNLIVKRDGLKSSFIWLKLLKVTITKDMSPATTNSLFKSKNCFL